MVNKTLWMIASPLLVAALIAVSCGPQAATTPTTPSPTPAAPTPAAPTPATPAAPAPAAPTAVEKPKYGGTINVIWTVDAEVWDNANVLPRGLSTPPSRLIYEQLADADFTKGVAGSKLVDWSSQAARLEGFSGFLGESWTYPEIGKWIFQIRKGIRWALNPQSEASRLMNGREFTADDVVWNIELYNKAPRTSWITLSQPALAKETTVEKTGPWEVTIKSPVQPAVAWHWIVQGGGNQFYLPKEVIQKYGNVQDWRNSVGTGPFMAMDYIPGSIVTLGRNPNYWRKNTIGPGKGDQLPYVDTVKMMIIVDLSTRLAALRTARADWITDIQAEDAASILRTNSAIKFNTFLGDRLTVALRTDKPDLPFKDKRVRQALMMAIDMEGIKKDLYGGKASILVYPIDPSFDWVYVPLDKMPPQVQALFKYNPDKAKQLLAEAGYPSGFKSRMIVRNISEHMDLASAIKAMWSKVGVDIELQPRDTAVYNSINSNRAHEEMVLRGMGMGWPTYLTWTNIRGVNVNNASYINDPFGKEPVIEDYFARIQKNVFINQPEADKLVREFLPWFVEQAYAVDIPSPSAYTLWQPWVKNHNGERALGTFLPFVWIDQDLKEKTTGRR